MDNYLFPIKYKENLKTELKKIDNYIDDTNNWNYDRVNSPLIYEIGSTNKIHYFGTSHIMKLSDPEIETLDKDFHSFVKDKDNVVILIEDWELREFQSSEEALKQKGERGLIMLWAKN